MKKITIAIDGYSSCGKSTMAKDLAREIGYIYVDSGAMYRAVTLYALDNGVIQGEKIDESRLKQEMKNIHISFQFNAERGCPDTYLNGERVEDRIRTLEVSNHVSPVAALPFVREEMVRQQQHMGEEGGIIRREIPMYASKVMRVCPKCGKATREAFKVENGAKVRVCKKCGETI